MSRIERTALHAAHSTILVAETTRPFELMTDLDGQLTSRDGHVAALDKQSIAPSSQSTTLGE